jgi:hypothetical protein
MSYSNIFCGACHSTNVVLTMENHHPVKINCMNEGCGHSMGQREIAKEMFRLRKYVDFLADKRDFYKKMYSKYKDRKKRCPVCESTGSDEKRIFFDKCYDIMPCQYCRKAHRVVTCKYYKKALESFESLHFDIKNLYLDKGECCIQELKENKCH